MVVAKLYFMTVFLALTVNALAQSANAQEFYKGQTIQIVVGFAAGEIPRIPLNLPLLKGCGILGVSYGAFAKREPEANRALVGQLLAMTHLSQERLALAFQRRLARTNPGAPADQVLTELGQLFVPLPQGRLGGGDGLFA